MEGYSHAKFQTNPCNKYLEISSIVEWTFKNIHKVACNILIPVRTAHPDDPWDYYAGTQQVILQETPYISLKRFKNLTALDICKQDFFLKNPLLIYEKISIQNLIVMQPHDFLPNGEQDECDGCPNKTYWNGRLVSECRKEDYMLYGRPIMTVEKEVSPHHKFARRETKDFCQFRPTCMNPADSPAAQKYYFN